MHLLVRMGWHGLLRGVAEDQRPGLYVKQVVAPEHPAEHPDIDGLFLPHTARETALVQSYSNPVRIAVCFGLRS